MELQDIQNLCLELVAHPGKATGVLTERATKVLDNVRDELGELESDFRRFLVHTLFRIGVLGLKIEKYQSVAWSFLWQDCSEWQIQEETAVDICPMLHRALGVDAS